MLYKEYGKTGERVSAVGFGGMRFDGGAVQRGDLEQCAALVRYGHEKGINYFDTAPTYCDDRSEDIFGLALSGLPRDSFYITSKTNFGQLERPATEKGFFDRLEKSLKRLRVEHIDFYHLWCMLTLAKYRKQCDAMYGWFQKAKEQGLIRHIVISSHAQGEDVKAMLDEGLFEGVLLGYNALNYRYRLEAVKAAHANGMGLVIMNPLGGGVIPRNPERFAALKEEGYTLAQSALRFVAAQEEVTVALNGFTTKEQIDEAVSAMEGLRIRPADDIIAALPSEAEGFNTLCTGCGYCEYCPEGIPVSKYMDAYNQELLGGSALQRLNVHWVLPKGQLDSCTKCGKCEALCTQHLPIRERLTKIRGLLQP